MIAIAIDGLALDELHHEIRQSLRGGAAVEQSGDIGMLEARQDLALIAEALHHKGRILTDSDQLDRDLLLIRIIGSDRTVDIAHASRADLLDELVRTDVLAHPRVGPWDFGKAAGNCRRRIEEIIACRIVRRDQ